MPVADVAAPFGAPAVIHSLCEPATANGLTSSQAVAVQAQASPKLLRTLCHHCYEHRCWQCLQGCGPCSPGWQQWQKLVGNSRCHVCWSSIAQASSAIIAAQPHLCQQSQGKPAVGSQGTPKRSLLWGPRDSNGKPAVRSQGFQRQNCCQVPGSPKASLLRI